MISVNENDFIRVELEHPNSKPFWKNIFDRKTTGIYKTTLQLTVIYPTNCFDPVQMSSFGTVFQLDFRENPVSIWKIFLGGVFILDALIVSIFLIWLCMRSLHLLTLNSIITSILLISTFSFRFLFNY